jgi:DNA-binding CsgD family transcriptional regulator
VRSAKCEEVEVLTERQLECVKRLASSLTRKGIASTLGLDLRTVDYHLKRAADRLGLCSNDVAGFTRWAIRKRVISVNGGTTTNQHRVPASKPSNQ